MEELDEAERITSFSSYALDPDMIAPRPLQIIKRIDRNQDLRKTSRMTSSSSGYSVFTDESLGSVPDPPGGEQRLFIPKKRRQPVSWPQPQQSEYQCRPEDVHVPADTDDLDTTPKPRRSNSCESPKRAVPDYLTTPALSAKASLHFLKENKLPLKTLKPLKPLYEDDFGSKMAGHTSSQVAASGHTHETISPFDDWKNPSSTATSSRISSSNFDISEPDVATSTVGPYLLAPKLTVTPECKVLDDGITTL